MTKPIDLRGDERLRTAVLTGTRWLDHVGLWRPRDPDALVTGDHETAVLLLGGTFDLVGGGTSWPARGARKEPFAGRPMAVFLPRRCEFAASNGQGEILLIAARQPEVRDEPTGRAALSSKPLLPLAGSGKAFDPTSGEWRPAETFATSAESLPPRRFQRLTAGECTVERVFAADYKAATLSVDEIALQPGQTLQLADIPDRPACDELLLFVRAEVAVLVGEGTEGHTRQGDTVFVLPPAAAATFVVRAIDGRAYVVLAYAGKPPASGA